MKIFAFTDVHGDQNAFRIVIQRAKQESPDFMVCAGDLSDFGKHLDLMFKNLNALNIPILIIPGNHETAEDIKKVSANYNNIINLHQGVYEIGEYVFFGYGMGGFSFVDEKFERISSQFIKAVPKNKKIIFVTHAPIYNTKVDLIGMEHRGCRSSRDFIENAQPILAICGHFHENEKVSDKIGKTLIVNPGPDGILIEI